MKQNKKKEEIVQNINEILSLIEIGNIYEITGEDFTVLLKPTALKFIIIFYKKNIL